MKLADALKAMKAIFSQIKLSQEQLSDKSLIQYDGEAIAQGSVVYLIATDGSSSVLPDGDYVTKDNTSFTITDGSVSKVVAPAKSKETKPDPKQAQAAASGSTSASGTTVPGPEDDETPDNDITDLNDWEEDDIETDMSADGTPKDKKKPYGDVAYADPTNSKYPVDTEEHIRAAWNYINKKKNAAQYSASDLAIVREKIVAAWKDKIDPKGPSSLQKDTKEQKPTEKQTTDMDQEWKRVIAAFSSAKLPFGLKLSGATEATPSPALTVDVCDLISNAVCQAVSPIWDAVYALQALMQAESKINATSSTQIAAMSRVVELLAKAPNGTPVEAVVNPFKKEDVALTASREYQIMRAELLEPKKK